jgi:AmmeMemoRadiSam system protein B
VRRVIVQEVRPAAVAGRFYPGSRDELARAIDSLLAAAPASGACPKAIIAPHAGYVYSGPIAASVFARIRGRTIERVILVGPAHREFVDGLAWPGAARLATPLGEIEVDVDAIAALPELRANPSAHAREHCLEVELPFVQTIAPGAKVVPLLASRATPEQVGRVLERLWGGPETLIVISSDLSHYHPYATAQAKDRNTIDQILARKPTLDGDQACGAVGINGLSWLAAKKQLRVELVDLRNSGDTAGSKDEVVGYGALAYYEVA